MLNPPRTQKMMTLMSFLSMLVRKQLRREQRRKVLSFINFLEEEDTVEEEEEEEGEIAFAITNAVEPTRLAGPEEEEDDSFIDDM